MELEFHQLDRRYERLRSTCARRDSRVLASLDRRGQQLPAVVVAGGSDGRYVLVDGYKRVRALLKLGHDTVLATCWDLAEQEALLFGRLMHSAEGDSALKQAWLLRELRERFELTVEELARRFDRSLSWVSGRLGLVHELPESIQDEVRRSRLVAHAAMKFCCLWHAPIGRGPSRSRRRSRPLARALARPKRCASRSRAATERRGSTCWGTRSFFFARAKAASRRCASAPASCWSGTLGALGGMARRAHGRVKAGAVRKLLPAEQHELRRRADTARGDVEQLFEGLEQETDHAGRGHQGDDSEAC